MSSKQELHEIGIMVRALEDYDYDIEYEMRGSNRHYVSLSGDEYLGDTSHMWAYLSGAYAIKEDSNE